MTSLIILLTMVATVLAVATAIALANGVPKGESCRFCLLAWVAFTEGFLIYCIVRAASSIGG